MPSTVRDLGAQAFYKNVDLTSVVLNGGLASIGQSAFAYCSSLRAVSILQSVTNLGQYSFYQTGLTSVVLTEGLTSIGNQAFRQCSSLKSITIPSSLLLWIMRHLRIAV